MKLIRWSKKSPMCAAFAAMSAVVCAGIGCRNAPTPTEGDASRVLKIFGSPGFSPGQFSYPRAISVSPVDGRVFIVDKRARIQRFDPEGNYEREWRMPDDANGKPTGLFVDDRNRVFVADTHYARVICYDRDGRELFRFGSYGEGPGQFIFPECILVSPDGSIFVGEYGGNDRISKFSPDHAYLFSFADRSAGEGWTDRPSEILMDQSGILWVADCCHHRVNRYSAKGDYLGSFNVGDEAPTRLCYPYGMAMERSGQLVIADRGNSRLIRVTKEGVVVGTWGGAGRLPGQMLQPWGVALSANGTIYCLDSWNNRVQVIRW